VVRWQSAVVVAALLGVLQPASAQEPVAGKPIGPQIGPASGVARGSTTGNPYSGNPTAAYGSNPSNYTSTPESAKRRLSPQESAAQRQSGLDETQAKTLLEEKGYRHVGKVEPDPNSLWVWQAEVMKDGRPTRVGIDYRGNVLDLSSTQARPCTQPGVRPGAIGGLGVGSQLMQSDSCSAR
jgi:hypothetical protein